VSFANVGVIGSGSWGTALSLLLVENGLPVTLWGHDPAHTARMRETRTNPEYLPGIALPERLALADTLEDLHACDLLLVVTPSKAVREVAARIRAARPQPGAVLLSCTKGVERGTGLRMSQILSESLPGHPVAVLSGPSHAEEVARKLPTCVVLGSPDAAVAQRLQRAFSAAWFRAYTNDDVAGIELGGALKNIFAIAAGVCDGLGLGDNAKAALVTRALVELGRLAVALGARRETLMGLGGLGDLMVTCFSRHSRNRAVGERLGKGESLAEIERTMRMVAEGVPTTHSAFECAQRCGIEVPVIEQVKAILEGRIGPAEALARLFSRDPKAE